MPDRVIAIGDIHGCSAALKTLLRAIQPRPNDLIVTLGDYINRGPDSRGVLDELIRLRERCRLVSILGNHDEMLLRSRTGRPVVVDTTPAGGPRNSLERDWGRVLPTLSGENLAFLESCVDYHETEHHIFVHACYDPRLPMDCQPASLLRWQSLKREVPGPHVSGKMVIAGHTAQKTGEILDLGYLKCIDTYCYGGGWLTALEVRSGEVWQADARGRAPSRR